MKTSFRIASLAAGLLVSLSSSAFAQSGDCSTDADCPDSYSCDIIEYDACPPCVEGEECPPCETGTSSTCTPPPPQECSADNPCSGDDVCVTYTFESCSGSSTVPVCPPDEDCEPQPEPEEPECTSETESYCVPPYLAPCQADADCGGGFTCEDIEICQCSSDGAPGPDEPEPTDPPESNCTCEPLGEKYCQLIEVECTTDADCAGDLTCQEIFSDDAPTMACAEGEPCPEPDPVDPTSYCAPVGYSYYGTDVANGSYDEAVAEASGRDGNVTSSERSEFFPVDGDPSDGNGKSDPGGCSSTGGSGEASLLALLFGFIFAVRR